MVWLLIIFIVAVAFAPLLHFAPSKRQRRVARMREHAAVSGLFVEFRKPPGGDGRPWPVDVNAGSVIYYGKRIPAKRPGRINSASWRRDANDWIAVGGYVPVPASFEDLPPQILAASVDDGSCGVFWTEYDEGAVVDQIRSALERWTVALSESSK